MTFLVYKGLKMRRFWPLVLFVIILSIALISTQKPSAPTVETKQIPQRIISLAPSITETLFAIGAGQQVVGVTKYCDFPSETTSLPSVGGFIDPNIEAIVALQPDLVVLLANHSHVIKQLQQLHINVLAVSNTSLTDIQQTISTLGDATHHQNKAKQIIEKINTTITSIKTKTAKLAKPRVMISMGHSIGTEHIEQVFIAGQRDFYNDLIRLAGGTNAYEGTQLKVPSVSIEGIMQLNPEVILDIFPEYDDHLIDLAQTLERWHSLKYVDAIQNNRIHIIEESYATIPGPRIFLLLEKIAPLIHPEVDW